MLVHCFCVGELAYPVSINDGVLECNYKKFELSDNDATYCGQYEYSTKRILNLFTGETTACDYDYVGNNILTNVACGIKGNTIDIYLDNGAKSTHTYDGAAFKNSWSFINILYYEECKNGLIALALYGYRGYDSFVRNSLILFGKGQLKQVSCNDICKLTKAENVYDYSKKIKRNVEYIAQPIRRSYCDDSGDYGSSSYPSEIYISWETIAKVAGYDCDIVLDDDFRSLLYCEWVICAQIGYINFYGDTYKVMMEYMSDITFGHNPGAGSAEQYFLMRGGKSYSIGDEHYINSGGRLFIKSWHKMKTTAARRIHGFEKPYLYEFIKIE